MMVQVVTKLYSTKNTGIDRIAKMIDYTYIQQLNE